MKLSFFRKLALLSLVAIMPSSIILPTISHAATEDIANTSKNNIIEKPETDKPIPQSEFTEAHQFGVNEYVTVMAGSLNVAVGGETYPLHAYDSIKFKGDLDHKYINPSGELAILHFVIAYHSM
ncbi:cupin domain-containing protein [Sporolactobacillus terrae]|uniref:cupin domain-containing protein n=1 Tax=Sporolactobacillus terrae TaxID=269673 RepID=UPI0009DEE435|nr:cupin domain-containing protein [Sporolactobacillus terrae]